MTVLPDLTPREVQVVRLAARGLTNAQIADTLGIRAGTVRTHLKNVCHKATLSARTDQRWLVRVAYTLGQIERELAAA